MKKYELITELEVTPEKSKRLIDKFLDSFNDWDEYKDEFIGNEKVKIENEKDKWNTEYLRKHISLLSVNFSKKRLKHIKEIIEYVYDDEIEKKDLVSKKKIGLILVGISLIGIICLMLYKKYQIVQSQNQTAKVLDKDLNQTTRVIGQN